MAVTEDQSALLGGEGDTKVETPTEVKPNEKATEAKPDEVKPDEKATEAKPEGAPLAYEPFKVPEGHEPLDADVSNSLAEVARELNLTQDRAQKLVDTMLPAFQKRAAANEQETVDRWKGELRTDSVIGGAKLEENLGKARRALDTYGDDEVRQLLSGPFGSYPPLLRLLYRVGLSIQEDNFIGGKLPKPTVDANDRAAAAKIMFPKTPN